MILDASAFYAGVPFGSSQTYHTTPQIYDEIRHIKQAQNIIDILQDAGRLRICAPDDAHATMARDAAATSGDLPNLSEPDMSILALAIQMDMDIITDDYSVSNAAHHMGIRTHHVMTRGPAVRGRWRYRCPACKEGRPPGRHCQTCGASLRRRLHR